MNKRDWQAAFGPPDASFDAAVRQTLNQLEEEQKMLKISAKTVALALALVLMLSGVVYAASTGWMIGDYFGSRVEGQVPKGFSSGFQADYTQELCGLRFHIRDAYVDGDLLMALTEISRADGQPAIFITDGIDETDLIDYYDQALSFEPRDGRTIAEYAKDNDLPIHYAGSWFRQEKTGDGAGDEWAEDGFNRLVTFAQVEDIHSENGVAKVIWEVYARNENGQYVHQDMEITLPVDTFTKWEVPVHQAVEGLPVVVDALYLQQSPIELQVDIAYHLDTDRMPEAYEENSAAGFQYRFIHLCDPATGEQLPRGVRMVGTLRWLNDEHTAFQGALGSVGGGFAGDTLRLRFYDPWLDDYVGQIDVKIR